MMKRSSKELKRLAREQLNHRYSIPMGAALVASLIVSVIELPFSLSMGDRLSAQQIFIFCAAEYLIMLINYVLQTGVSLVHLNFTRNLPVKITTIFEPFRRSADRFIGAAFLTSLLSVLSSLPSVLAGLYLYFSGVTVFSILLLLTAILLSTVLSVLITLNYQFTDYFLLDYPKMKVFAAFRESRLLMRGNKGRFLYLLLSFLGFDCLTALSFGIAGLWVYPYMNQTYTNFYLDCTGEL